MKISTLLKLITAQPHTNFWVVCPDNLGIGPPLQGALSQSAADEDVKFIDAATITREKARQIEKDARFAPAGSSDLVHIFIQGMQKIPTGSVGPLLKVVEESKYARFIFQSQHLPSKIRTLSSRSSVVHLPFLTRKVVLGNIQQMNLDAKEAEKSKLYDGTLGGTIRALSMKDTIGVIRREMGSGTRGTVGLFTEELINSLALEAATADSITPRERAYINKQPSKERKKITLYVMLARGK